MEKVNSEVTKEDNTTSTEGMVFWVNSLPVTCVGVAPMQCLQIQKNEQFSPNKWQFFYDDIKGFNYEQGYIYKLLVKEEKLRIDDVPADASSYSYSLISILKKEADSKFKLNDTWLLESIANKKISLVDYRKKPQLTINLQQMRISGNDSCNQFFSGIKLLTSHDLVFEPLGTTFMYCEKMDIADEFHEKIKKVTAYILKGSRLNFLDKDGKTLLSFIVAT